MAITNQRIKKLEKSVRQNTEDVLVVLPNHLENQVNIPPNVRHIFLATEFFEKSDISWQENFEQFRIR